MIFAQQFSSHINITSSFSFLKKILSVEFYILAVHLLLLIKKKAKINTLLEDKITNKYFFKSQVFLAVPRSKVEFSSKKPINLKKKTEIDEILPKSH